MYVCFIDQGDRLFIQLLSFVVKCLGIERGDCMQGSNAKRQTQKTRALTRMLK